MGKSPEDLITERSVVRAGTSQSEASVWIAALLLTSCDVV